MKQQFPFLGARIETRGSQAFFVVEEQSLRSTLPTEVIVRNVASVNDTNALVFDLMNGGKYLSNNKLARLFILPETNRPNFHHIIFHGAHCIADEAANIAFTRTFLDRLSSTDPLPIWDIKQQLALSVSSDALVPRTATSVARQRWHKAIGWGLGVVSMSGLSVN